MESQDKDDLPSFPVVGALNRRRPQRRLPNPLNHAFRAVPPENRPVPQKVYRRPVTRRQEPAERSRHICGTSLESSMLGPKCFQCPGKEPEKPFDRSGESGTPD